MMRRCTIRELHTQTLGDCTPTSVDVDEAKKIMKHRVPSKASIHKKLVALYGERGEKVRQRADERLKKYEVSEIKKAKNDCCRDNQTPESIMEEAGAIRKALNQYTCLDAVYVGRPYHQGYRVPTLKQGSILANPFSLKECGTPEMVMHNFMVYIKARLTSASKEELVTKLLEEDIKLPDRPHLQLSVVGQEFRDILDAHRDKNLACVCKLSDPCHVDVLLSTMSK